MRAISPPDCPEGYTMINGECVKHDFIGQDYSMVYDPALDGVSKTGSTVFINIPYPEKTYKDYELTPEEHARFDSVEGCTKEEIEAAKKLLSKSIRVEVDNNSIEILSQMIEKYWFEKKPERKVDFYIGEAQKKLFDEYVRKEFSKSTVEKDFNLYSDRLMEEMINFDANKIRQRRS